MAYERLTIKRHDKNYIKTQVDGVHDFLVITNRVGKYEYTTGEVIDRLAELEDKIENGMLIEIPENAVVLTEQEQNKILKATEKRIDQLKKQVELTRKETAKEIIILLGKGFDETKMTEFKNLPWYRLFCRELKHRYDLEVEE